MRTSLSVVALLVLLVVVSLAVLVWAPVAVSFGAALAFAIAWCIWLERHPAT